MRTSAWISTFNTVAGRILFLSVSLRLWPFLFQVKCNRMFMSVKTVRKESKETEGGRPVEPCIRQAETRRRM